MNIDWWTLGLQTVNLLVLLWILGRFLFRPMTRIIAGRQAEADRLLADADAARDRARVAEQAAQAERDNAAGSRGALLDKAREEAEAQRAALLDAAQKDAQKLIADARTSIDQMRAQEQVQTGARAAQLAVDIADRLLLRLPGPVPVAGFIAGFEQALTALPEAARASIAAAGQSAILKSTSPLSTTEQQQLSAAIERATGHAVSFTQQSDPSLIAGLRLETPNAIINNNLRADLDRIAAELTSHDAG